MDSSILLLEKYKALPDSLKPVVEKYIDYLIYFNDLKLQEKGLSDEERKKKNRIFGIAKGMFKMKDDFDEPLDEFKDYM